MKVETIRQKKKVCTSNMKRTSEKSSRLEQRPAMLGTAAGDASQLSTKQVVQFMVKR